MLLSIKGQHKHGGTTWKRCKWCNKQWVWGVCTSSNRRAKERAEFHEEKEILSDDAKHAKVFDTFFLQSLLKGAPFNTTSMNSVRLRIPAARKNEEVRQCLNKSDIFHLTNPKSFLPYQGKQLKATQCHQHRSQGWGGFVSARWGRQT